MSELDDLDELETSIHASNFDDPKASAKRIRAGIRNMQKSGGMPRWRRELRCGRTSVGPKPTLPKGPPDV